MTTSPVAELTGAQEPQLRNVPPYVSSAGPEAIALARDGGLALDEAQRNVLMGALGERADGRWSAFRVAVIESRQNGKGSILEARVIAGLNLFDERLIMWTAHEMKTAMEAFRRVEALIEGSDDLRRRVRTFTRSNGNEGVEFRNGARLRFVARSKGSGRGFSGDCVILDEAYAVTPEQLAALMPTMSARPNPQLWFTSSPPLDAETGEVLFRLRDNAIAGDPRLAYFDWGLQDVDLSNLSSVDLSDRRLWALTNPAYGTRIDEEFIAQEFAAMPPVEFARERLGIWPPRDSGATVINLAEWAKLADRAAQPGADVAFAVDIAPDRRTAAIVMYGQRPDGVGYLEVVDHREGTDWLVDRLAGLRDRWKPAAVGLDVGSPAGSLLLDLERAGFRVPEDPDRPQRGDLAVPTTREVAAACGQLVDAVAQRTLRHADQPPLNSAVAGVKTRPLGDAWAFARRTSSVDISPLCGAALARWAYTTRLGSGDYDPLANFW